MVYKSQPIKLRGVVSLLDMMRFYGDLFVQTLTRILQWEIKCARIVNNPATQVSPGIAVEIYAYVGTLIPELLTYGFENASLKAGRIQERLQTAHMLVSYGEMVSQLRELRERIEDDFHRVVFVSLTPEDSKLYDDPDKGWEDVTHRFGKIRHDIEECSKCFALARYGAAVFHVMLIAEFGVIQVANLFGVAGDRPGWGALERLQKINDKDWKDKTALEQKHSKFLENLLPLAFAMKESWRHKMDHVANKIEWMDTDFSPEVANDIISATRGFMRRLASDLPK
ncbi:MAG TPA: hypothetical protein VE377_22150 [Candidatus Dormibacteraeota bacterium]|nr:hypothetical protein [Candidatus Dormibacteraeota bacterium]